MFKVNVGPGVRHCCFSFLCASLKPNYVIHNHTTFRKPNISYNRSAKSYNFKIMCVIK